MVPVGSFPLEYRGAVDKGFSTGWKNLDKLLGGIRMGELTVITADTGSGKTTFCTQLVFNCALHGVAVWVNSWEMKPEMIMRKLASLVLRRPMKLQKFSEHENEQFDEWCCRHKVYINPKTIGVNIFQLGKQLLLAKDLGVKVVMLDHLDYLVNDRKEKLHEAIDETVKALHELAFALDMHFLLICHPRQSTSGSDEIGLHSLKGSSSIKQYADNVLILHRCSRSDKTAHPGKVKVHVAKNRLLGLEGNAILFYDTYWDGYSEFTGI